jgi:hypothetical protein
MRTFAQFIDEAAPPSSLTGQKFYHGTYEQAAAEAIQHEGIKPPEITYKKASRLTPMRGKVYLTASLGEAMAYVMGGSIAGHGWKDTPKEDRSEGIPDSAYSMPARMFDIDKEPYGYMFVIAGSELKDVDPDEDSVGLAVYQLFNRHFHGPMGSHLEKALGQTVLSKDHAVAAYGPDGNDRTAAMMLASIAQRRMTSRQFRDVVFGEYDQFAAGGKRIMKHLPDWIKQKLIEWGANVAHGGVVMPSECWQIDRRRDIPLLGHGKTFFDVAKRIK